MTVLTDGYIKRKIAIYIKLCDTTVVEMNLDEINLHKTILFAQPNLNDNGEPLLEPLQDTEGSNTTLKIYWRYSFSVSEIFSYEPDLILKSITLLSINSGR